MEDVKKFLKYFTEIETDKLTNEIDKLVGRTQLQ